MRYTHSPHTLSLPFVVVQYILKNYEWLNEHIFLIRATRERERINLEERWFCVVFSQKECECMCVCFTYNCVYWPQALLLIFYTKIGFKSLVQHPYFACKKKIINLVIKRQTNYIVSFKTCTYNLIESFDKIYNFNFPQWSTPKKKP